MANSYFQFKQFTIHQSQAAMKVGTDGVLLGAWADIDSCSVILDVGTGTGLIALMMAQRNAKAMITAIDIDEGAVKQAVFNVEASDWSNRILVELCPLQAFKPKACGLFDHVVCNPPFFNNAFKSENQSRTRARHTDSLSYNDLVAYAHQLTHEKGRLSLIIPYDSSEELISSAKHVGWYLHKRLNIRPTPNKKYVRALVEFIKEDVAEACLDDMIIEDKGRHKYSDKYIALTKDFYLAM
ncbi:methyltransferase [Carboxylicivirga sediminis]|uniref:tRNA1(Val) (adenine(37)-N6)-methyltransferase n=1 Tax=Carboxylicivirga sediminis TaxID=2006564 RepID=A0A941IY90_9BACT|nr:methyltransferase [Carboxylicivirga sediminis]MBR8536760.1 methyltransferase [Carboxylicivirga sediminis]